MVKEMRAEDFIISKTDTSCRMGKWYATLGHERFGHTKSFKEMDNPHARVHENVFKNFKFVKEKNTLKHDHPEIIYQNFLLLEDASAELFSKLDSMLEEYSLQKTA